MDESKKVKKIACQSCGNKFPEDKLRYGPDPYNEEINDDDTDVYLCDDCYQLSIDSI